MRCFEDFREGEILESRGLAITGIGRLRFTRPVFIGDTIRLTKKVLATQERSAESGLVTFETTLVNQNGRTVLVYTDKIVIGRR